VILKKKTHAGGVFMNMSTSEYLRLVDRIKPKSKTFTNALRAFAFGGTLCLTGQLIANAFVAGGSTKTNAALIVSLIFICAGAGATMAGIYDKIAEKVGAGILIPITGFANSLVSAAMEFRAEGSITGMAVKMFVVAGPVIVFGIAASVVYGIVYVIIHAVAG